MGNLEASLDLTPSDLERAAFNTRLSLDPCSDPSYHGPVYEIREHHRPKGWSHALRFFFILDMQF